jgi:hypothetical protein
LGFGDLGVLRASHIYSPEDTQAMYGFSLPGNLGNTGAAETCSDIIID